MDDARTVDRTFTELTRFNEVLQASPLGALAAHFGELSRLLAAGEISRDEFDERMAEGRRRLGFPVGSESEPR
ncbi:hypothetical protein [Catellatospora sp. NPDC049609]|uniref:hypothetical protein n=1 Tax=Catellatospora sp. NPDC049609 TaxID=3155505 RepID=UPI00342E78AF